MIMKCVTVTLPTEDYCEDFFCSLPSHILAGMYWNDLLLLHSCMRFYRSGVKGRGRVEARRTDRGARQVRMRMSVQVKSESASDDDARKVGPGPFLDWTYVACQPQGSKYVSEVRSVAPVIGSAANQV
jgi:hypothetical protein